MKIQKEIHDNERVIGTVVVFDADDIPTEKEEIGYIDNWMLTRGMYGYAARLAEVTRGDLIRWGKMERAKKVGKMFEYFAEAIAPQMDFPIYCGNSSTPDTYDGVQEFLYGINSYIASGDKDIGPTFHTEYSSIEEAMNAAIYQLKIASREQKWRFFWGGMEDELYNPVTENYEIGLNLMKILDFELWSETEAIRISLGSVFREISSL